MTLNQQYKLSNSDKSFKDWLFEKQKEGSLDFNSEQLMSIGSETEKPMDFQLFGVSVKYIGIGLIVIIGGYFAYKKFVK